MEAPRLTNLYVNNMFDTMVLVVLCINFMLIMAKTVGALAQVELLPRNILQDEVDKFLTDGILGRDVRRDQSHNGPPARRLQKVRGKVVLDTKYPELSAWLALLSCVVSCGPICTWPYTVTYWEAKPILQLAAKPGRM
jgi:hypothetical protein